MICGICHNQTDKAWVLGGIIRCKKDAEEYFGCTIEEADQKMEEIKRKRFKDCIVSIFNKSNTTLSEDKKIDELTKDLMSFFELEKNYNYLEIFEDPF